MNLPELVPAVLVITAIGILVGIGIIVLDQMGDTTKVSTTVANETITVASGTVNFANDDVTLVNEIQNASGEERWFRGDGIASTGYSASATWNWTTVTLVTNATDAVYNVSYTYDADQTATTAVFSTRDVVDDFVIWIPTIVIILAAAVILTITLNSFRRP